MSNVDIIPVPDDTERARELRAAIAREPDRKAKPDDDAAEVAAQLAFLARNPLPDDEIGGSP